MRFVYLVIAKNAMLFTAMVVFEFLSAYSASTMQLGIGGIAYAITSDVILLTLFYAQYEPFPAPVTFSLKQKSDQSRCRALFKLDS